MFSNYLTDCVYVMFRIGRDKILYSFPTRNTVKWSLFQDIYFNGKQSGVKLNWGHHSYEESFGASAKIQYFVFKLVGTWEINLYIMK